MTRINFWFISIMFIGIHDIRCGKHNKTGINKDKTQKKMTNKSEPIILKLINEIKKNK